ncbi:MAG: hypothetical protein NUW12_08225 [Firmicutes bacterium]|jgi:hypothetical protein|nr:hypothetical protein [Bacillota bacterium]MDH7495366.1 hypothetical protein [Bacillota bacterium]
MERAYETMVFLTISTGCVLAAYPVLKVPATGVLALMFIAVGLMAAGQLSRRFHLSTWGAGVVALEYCVSLVLSDRYPGVVEPVVVGLGILVFLDLSHLSLLSFTPFVAHATALTGMVETRAIRGFARRLAGRVVVIAAVSILLSATSQELTRGVSLPMRSTFPLLVAGASLAGLSMYCLTCLTALGRLFGAASKARQDRRPAHSRDPEQIAAPQRVSRKSG